MILLAQAKAASWSQDLTLLWADAGFRGQAFEAQVQQQFGWTLDIGQQPAGQKGFSVQRKRWLVEQMFGGADVWWSRCLAAGGAIAA